MFAKCIKKFKIYMRKEKIMKKIIIVLFIAVLLLHIFYAKPVYSVNSDHNYSNRSCCNNKIDIDNIYEKPTISESLKLVSIVKTQKIFSKYDEYLREEGYQEYKSGIFIRFFKKTIDNFKDSKVKKDPYNSYKLACLSSCTIYAKKPFIVSIPYINIQNKNKIAGIILVYSNNQIFSYIVKVNTKNLGNGEVNFLFEDDNNKIIEAEKIVTPEFYFDPDCAKECVAECAVHSGCEFIPPPFDIPCYAACWGICYDMCAINKP